ncbi:hypothetical protein CK203_058262 [Vitis vinifera]|uniref:Uncharacterized protein n=1 Tax=Vitis vinifera TaxID=29760 RepID=A0A438FTQ8_VITVI|nr:hypothetical protein CK203_058262 [Vitis vinifera]
MHHLKWARLLIKSRGRKVPNRLMVVVRGVVFVVRLWWEFSPSLLTTVSKRSCKRPKVAVQGPMAWVTGVNEALLVEVADFKNGRLLDLTRSEEKGPMGKELVAKAKELEIKQSLRGLMLVRGGGA